MLNGTQYVNPLEEDAGAPVTFLHDSAPPPDPLSTLVQRLGFDDLFTPEPAPQLIVPALGFAPGPPIGFFGQGYVGKSIVAMSVGVSIAAGKPIWGQHRCDRGRWLHLDHEQGKRHDKSRIQRLVAGMGIEREELRGYVDVAVFPKLNLTTADAEDLYVRLCEDYSFVTIDALKGATPGIDENSSAIRDYIDILSRVSERSGATICQIHHAGKTPMQGSRARKESGRGSSAIFDACAAVFVLTSDKGEPIHVTHEKDRELGATLPDFGLRIVDVEIAGDPKGGLRVEHLEPEQLRERSAANGIDKIVSRVVAVVGRHPECGSRVLRSQCKGRAADVDAGVEEAERRGLIRNLGNERRPKWRLTAGGS